MQLSVRNSVTGRTFLINHDPGDQVIGHSLQGMRWWDFMTTGRLYRASISYTGNNIFVDVGANIGTTSVLASEWFKFIICFEPMQQNVSYLRQNLSNNNVPCLLIQKAVSSSSNSSIRFCGFKELNSGIAHAIREHEAVDDSVLVKTVRLDDALAGMKPAFVHIDAEGYDLICLHSYISQISNDESERSRRPFIQIEFCPQAFIHYTKSLDTLWGFLDDYCYCAYIIFNNHLAPIGTKLLKELADGWLCFGGNIWTDLLLLPREFQYMDFYRA